MSKLKYCQLFFMAELLHIKMQFSKNRLTNVSTCFNILTVLKMLIQLMVIIRLWEALLSEKIGDMVESLCFVGWNIQLQLQISVKSVYDGR